ncbi:hypothetical protein C8Q78DRAFT_1025333 [Trametes maxima]|nr:hypothetical protein C8Q78DRAFT_1025333 [Trametes maxima]
MRRTARQGKPQYCRTCIDATGNRVPMKGHANKCPMRGKRFPDEPSDPPNVNIQMNINEHNVDSSPPFPPFPWSLPSTPSAQSPSVVSPSAASLPQEFIPQDDATRTSPEEDFILNRIFSLFPADVSIPLSPSPSPPSASTIDSTVNSSGLIVPLTPPSRSFLSAGSPLSLSPVTHMPEPDGTTDGLTINGNDMGVLDADFDMSEFLCSVTPLGSEMQHGIYTEWAPELPMLGSMCGAPSPAPPIASSTNGTVGDAVSLGAPDPPLLLRSIMTQAEGIVPTSADISVSGFPEHAAQGSSSVVTIPDHTTPKASGIRKFSHETAIATRKQKMKAYSFIEQATRRTNEHSRIGLNIMKQIFALDVKTAPFILIYICRPESILDRQGEIHSYISENLREVLGDTAATFLHDLHQKVVGFCHAERRQKVNLAINLNLKVERKMRQRAQERVSELEAKMAQRDRELEAARITAAARPAEA